MSFDLTEQPAEAALTRVRAALAPLGVHRVDYDVVSLDVSYDPKQIKYDELVEELRRRGIPAKR